MNYFLLKKPLLKRLMKVMICQTAMLFLLVSLCYANPDIGKTRSSTVETRANIVAAINVSGKVTDKATGDPIPGVTIKVKDLPTGATTDANGNYTINNVAENAILVASYVGYATTEINVNGQAVVNIQLAASNNELSEIVVVGYGTQKKTSTTAAVATLQVNDIVQKPVVNITNSLVGRLSGLIATQGNGEPGQDGSTLTVRGPATTGRTGALTIVDGVPRDFSRLDPNTIETLTILKDAAAVAPYGVAGANGVIVITTKQGKTGKPTLSYTGYYGVQNPTNIPRFVDAVQYATLRNEAAVNDAKPGATDVNLPFTARDIELYGNGRDPDGHPNSRPLEEIIQKNAPISYHNISLSGGTDAIEYFASLGLNRQEGMWSSSNLTKYNGSLSVTAKATSSTSINIRVNSYQEDLNYPAVGAGSILRQAQRQNPITPVRYTNGIGAGYIGETLYGYIHQSGYEKVKNNALLTQLSIDQKLPIKGLSLKGVLSYDKGPDPLGFSPVQNSLTRRYRVPIPYTNPVLPDGVTEYGPGVNYLFPIALQGEQKPLFRQTTTENNMATYQGILNYSGTFGKSEFTGLFVTEYRDVKWQSFYAERANYDLTIDELDFGGTAPSDSRVGGVSGGQKQLGYVYRLTYGYAGKYFVEAAGRYDGSYVFGPGNRFGFFPAFSAGWRLSEENFMKKFTWINNLKLRGSYGESGNYPNIQRGLGEIGDQYYSLDQFGVDGSSAVIGNGITQGISENLQGNRNITWERAKKSNVGIEANLWNGLLGIEADYFYEKRSNFLVDQVGVLPAEYGVALGQVNGGILSNRGVDFTLSTFKTFSNGLRLDVRGTFTYAKSKVIQKFENASTLNNPNRRETGRPLGQQFGLQSLGYYTADDFVDPSEQFPKLKPGIPVPNWGQVRPGDIKYADLNSASFDGNPDGRVDNNDLIDIGNPTTPQIIYGLATHLTFKNFDIDLLFQGSGRSNLRLESYYVFPFDGSGSVSEMVYLDHWSPSNPNATYPRISSSPISNNVQASTHYMRNNSYIRLRSAELGYTISNKFINRAVKSLRVYASGQNLFYWTPWMKEPVDPENNGGAISYYQQQVFSFGINATF